MAKLTYIYHDCFVFETEKEIFVFDFWKDPFSPNKELPYFLEIADKSKNLIVIVSHHHKDHYNKNIFKWFHYFNSTKYILSKDTAKYCRHIINPHSIYKGFKPDSKDIHILSPGETYKQNDFEIHAFESTDIGNSYLLNISNRTLFHAGDLNAWTWQEESDQDEIDEMTQKFINIIDSIKEIKTNFDIVMFPVDPRMGKGFYEGAKLFNEAFKTSYFLPMHFCLAESEEKEIIFRKLVWKTELYINKKNVKSCILLTAPYSAITLI